jgi:hypothetical protein
MATPSCTPGSKGKAARLSPKKLACCFCLQRLTLDADIVCLQDLDNAMHYFHRQPCYWVYHTLMTHPERPRA